MTTPDKASDKDTANKETTNKEALPESNDDEQREWSGEPNGSLVVELSDTPPGRVLDVGCGEGGDAIWLAKLGWDVTAVDTSEGRIRRARLDARKASVQVVFQIADITTNPPAADTYDLVTLSYPGIDRPAGKATMLTIARSLIVGGELLVIGHARTEDNQTFSDSSTQKRFDPERFLSVDDITTILRPTFTVTVDETRNRPQPPEGTRHLTDRILRARRIS